MTQSLRLVQLTHPQGRFVALVNEPGLILLTNVTSVYDLAMQAIEQNEPLHQLVQQRLSSNSIDYNEVYNGTSEYRLLPSFDHPKNPAACLVSGTGLTHKNSALNRQMMHAAAETSLTDSMQMYQWGIEGGHPTKGAVGVQPEWFYKGTGESLKAHNETLETPGFGNDGGEEPEVAGIYIVDRNGKPWRIGFTTGNEFSDHVMEKKNYLYLAPSKLRNCAIGPELVLNASFTDIEGNVSIERNGSKTWSKPIRTGENNMAHSLANLEHHHFKYPGHRVAGQAHVHFFGADAFSFGDKLQLQQNDVMVVEWFQLGRALRNPLAIAAPPDKLVEVEVLQ